MSSFSSFYVSPWPMQAQPYHPTFPYQPTPPWTPTISLPSTELANFHSNLPPSTIIRGKHSLIHCSLDMTYLATLMEQNHIHSQKSQLMVNKSPILTIFFRQDRTNFFLESSVPLATKLYLWFIHAKPPLKHDIILQSSMLILNPPKPWDWQNNSLFSTVALN